MNNRACDYVEGEYSIAFYVKSEHVWGFRIGGIACYAAGERITLKPENARRSGGRIDYPAVNGVLQYDPLKRNGMYCDIARTHNEMHRGAYLVFALESRRFPDKVVVADITETVFGAYPPKQKCHIWCALLDGSRMVCEKKLDAVDTQTITF